jgi:peptidoglycan/LPS O-acetylase OafA/YrhL
MATYPPDQPAPLASSANMAESPRNSETSESAGERYSARLLLQIDGSFEALLGVFLMCSAVTGLHHYLDLPDPPAGPVALVVFGLLFLALGPVLWRLSRAPRPQILLQLAVANGAGALILVLWVLGWNRSFHPAGAVMALVVAAILASLAVLQARAARSSIPSRHR